MLKPFLPTNHKAEALLSGHVKTVICANVIQSGSSRDVQWVLDRCVPDALVRVEIVSYNEADLAQEQEHDMDGDDSFFRCFFGEFVNLVAIKRKLEE